MMKTSKSEPVTLKPCPFCPDGGKPYFTRAVNGTQMAYVGCSQCGISLKAQVQGYGPDAPLSKDIIAIWNTRPSFPTSAARAAAEEVVKRFDSLGWFPNSNAIALVERIILTHCAAPTPAASVTKCVWAYKPLDDAPWYVTECGRETAGFDGNNCTYCGGRIVVD
jgi:hypothetical protein